MLGKCLTVGITLFWVTMMTLLLEREILPAWRAEREAARTPSYARLEALAEKGQMRQMGIYRGEPPEGRRIGRTLSTLRKDGAEMLMTSDTRIALDLGSGETPFHFQFQASVIAGELSVFHLAVFLGPAEAGTAADKTPVSSRGNPRAGAEPWATLDGRPVNGVLKLRIHEGGATEQLTMPFDSRRMLSDLLSPTFTPAQLRVGESWAFSTFDPISRGVGTATAHVTRRERIKVDGIAHGTPRTLVEEDTFVIRLTSGGLEATVWADRQGEVVKEKVLGFILLREEPDGE